jgi:tetratricopeptide (TPR) repeat protein
MLHSPVERISDSESLRSGHHDSVLILSLCYDYSGYEYLYHANIYLPMRLLKLNEDGSFRLETFSEEQAPPYTILSHTWSTESDNEVKLQDIRDGTFTNKPGYQKLLFCSKQSKQDGLLYCWIDSCCIDQTNHVELSKAINSMFRWYQKAVKCYVYLLDVSRYTPDGKSHSGWESAFYNSRWFTRGWTLQELLAPKIVEFYSLDEIRLGDKHSLERQIAEITRIPSDALHGDELSKFSVEERFLWAQDRQTTEAEDKAHCLVGIFDIYLPLMYGIGESKAMERLRREIKDSGHINPLIDTHRPSHSIPFMRNRRFIGRNTILEELEQKLLTDMDTQHVAIVGLGGVGKTQAVLEFAYRVQEGWPDYSIFWIPALSMESVEQACSEIAKALKIPNTTEDEDVKELVRQHLSSDAAGKWLLIVDNADDINLLFDGVQQSQGIIDYLPQSKSGLTVFTTRYQEIATQVAGIDVIELEEMNHQEAVSFLEQSLASNSVARKEVVNNANATKLLEELVYLPLAIAQAAAYLSRNKNLTISSYLQLLQKTEQDFVRLLSHEFRDVTRYRDSAQYQDKNTENAVAKTWLVSFNQIREKDKVAADLLCFISCIESKAIPHSILPSIEPEERMVQAIGTLCGYLFIVDRGDQNTYDTHRLVHLSARIWIEKIGLSAVIIEKAIQHISAIFPTPEFTNQGTYRKYLTHALRLLTDNRGRDIQARYTLCLKVGQCLYEEGRIRESVRWTRESYKWREANLAEDHPDRLVSQYALASAYKADGQIAKAIELLEHVVAVEAQVLMEDHPNQLASQHALAGAYQADGQITKAIELLEHVVTVEAQVLAEDHPSRLASQHELAGAYQADGQIAKAVELLEHVVTVGAQVLAEDHPSRLASQHELASAYKADGQIAKAIELLEHVVTVKAQVLAEDHPSRLVSQHALASAYKADGQITKAIKLLEHVVTVRAQVLAEDHPSRLASQHELAGAYQADGQIAKAIELLEHVVTVGAQVLAEDHPSRLASQHELAGAYQADGQIAKAIELLEYVVAVGAQVLAEDHPSRLASQHELAGAYQADGQIAKAIELLEHVVAVEARILRADHPSRLISQNMLEYFRAELLDNLHISESPRDKS